VPTASEEVLKEDDYVRVGVVGSVLKRINPLLDLQSYGMPRKKGLSRCLEHPDIQPYFEIRVLNNIHYMHSKSLSKINAEKISKQHTESPDGLVAFCELYPMLVQQAPDQLSKINAGQISKQDTESPAGSRR
jgi:hypothetical protein